MQTIMDLIGAIIGVFRVVLAVPIFGPLLLLTTAIPFIVKAKKHR